MIREQLKKQGYSVSQVAKELHVNRSAVYQSINGMGSRAIRIKIAILLETPPSLLWKENDIVTRACDDVCFMSDEKCPKKYQSKS